jgi:hypothetical protein
MACRCRSSPNVSPILTTSVFRGAVGLIRATARLGVAPEEVTRARRDICRTCNYATRNDDPKFAANQGLTTLSRCTRCRCFIGAKTRLTAETCPLGKWKQW